VIALIQAAIPSSDPDIADFILSAIGLHGASTNAAHGFYDDAFPNDESGRCGNKLKTAYLDGGKGTYRWSGEYHDWEKQ
jgi:hypothetical protein